MPEGFNWLDAVIAIFLVISFLQGIRVGLIRNIFTIIGIAAAVTVAIKSYAHGSEIILNYIGLPRFFADFVSFIIIFSIISLTFHFIGSIFSYVTRISLIRVLDKIGGSLAGLAIGLAIAGVFLILLTAFPVFASFPDHVEQSYLAPPIIDSTHLLYDELSELLPFDLPHLSTYPEEMSRYLERIDSYSHYHDIDFAALDGAACFVCGGPVEFLGYLENDMGSISPKFVCSRCGRTSDGCQTYDGYHQMYEQCPVELGNKGYRLDCGIWSNNSYYRPTGPCPICGIE